MLLLETLRLKGLRPDRTLKFPPLEGTTGQITFLTEGF